MIDKTFFFFLWKKIIKQYDNSFNMLYCLSFCSWRVVRWRGLGATKPVIKVSSWCGDSTIFYGSQNHPFYGWNASKGCYTNWCHCFLHVCVFSLFLLVVVDFFVCLLFLPLFTWRGKVFRARFEFQVFQQWTVKITGSIFLKISLRNV